MGAVTGTTWWLPRGPVLAVSVVGYDRYPYLMQGHPKSATAALRKGKRLKGWLSTEKRSGQL